MAAGTRSGVTYRCAMMLPGVARIFEKDFDENLFQGPNLFLNVFNDSEGNHAPERNTLFPLSF